MLIDLRNLLSGAKDDMTVSAPLEMETFRTALAEYPVMEKQPVELVLTRTGKDKLHISGNGFVALEIPCDRCLEPVRTEMHFDIDKDIDMQETSGEIEDEEEKKRLISYVENVLPDGTGAIIRTAAENKEKDAIAQDLNDLIKKWEDIISQDCSTYPQIIYHNDSLIKKILIDLIEKKIDTVIVDNEENFKEIQEIIKEQGKTVEVKKVSNAIEEEGLEDKIEKLKNRNVWLNCGGFITIDKTEALTAIDVNSGKYDGKTDLETTAYTVNLEATDEIAKQLKLRDIGGIIIVDYIDMLDNENKKKIQDRMLQNLKADRAKTQVEGFTKLNLMELTRKHICNNEE